MINDVLPPTHDRHFFGGDATSFEGIDQSDLFTLALVDNLSLFIDEMAHPLQPVRLSGDELYGEDPYYVLYVTPRQWNDWYTSTSGKDWNQMMTRAVNRSKGFNHPLFKGECAMWRNILVRKYAGMPIRFYKDSRCIEKRYGSNHRGDAGQDQHRPCHAAGGSGAGECVRPEGRRSLQHG